MNRTTTYERERDVALAAVEEASRLCQAVQGDLEGDVLEKNDRTPVTVADFGSQALICRALGEAFPDDPIVGEEDSSALRRPENAKLLEEVAVRVQAVQPGANEAAVCEWIDRGTAEAPSERFWTLDPIDGTKGFLRGDQYAIALALIVGGEVQVAMLACPNFAEVEGAARGERGLVLRAVRGQGTSNLPAFRENGRERVQVSDTRDPAKARFCESFVSAHSSHDAAARVADHLGITKEPVRIDSQAKYALVARGDADIYLRLPREGYVERIWDHAAGMLAVEAAGGKVTDLDGKPLDFTRGRRLEANRGIVATNGHLHEKVLEAIDAVAA